MARLLGTSKNLATRVPSKFDVPMPVKSKKIKLSDEFKSEIRLKFIETFRKLVDFTIPALTPNDEDYEEFSKDPKSPLLTILTKLEEKTAFEVVSYPATIIIIRRLLSKTKYRISINNMHRVLAISLMIVNKFIEDIPASNSDFALSIGFDPKVIDNLEVEFLLIIDFNVCVTYEEIEEVLSEWNFTLNE